MTKPQPRRTWILALLLVVFGALFVWRGPVRAVNESADLAHLYAASVLWLEGGNPYDGEQCVEVMRQAGHGKPAHVANGSFYPPSTIAALAPLGVLSWDSAKLVWMLMNLAAGAVIVWALFGWLDFGSTATRWLFAALLVVMWGPTATTFSLGQLSLVSAACVFAGLVMMDRDKTIAAGVLIAVGCLIKPQLGLGFLLLIAMRRHWLAVGVATAAIAVVTGLGIGRLMLTAPDWAAQMAGNIASDQGPGEVLDASLLGPMRYQMIDLRPLLHLAMPSGWVNLAALLIVSLLALIANLRLIKRGLRKETLLTVSGVGLLVLMPVYHRYYDAVLLLPLLALTANLLTYECRSGLVPVVAFAMVPLIFPLPAILSIVEQKDVLPEALTSSWFWHHIVLQIHSWSLLIASLALIAGMYLGYTINSKSA